MNNIPVLESKPPAHPDSVNGRLANSLDSQREEIIAEWLHRVGKDSAIPTEPLTLPQLRDHLPQLLADLIETLSRYGSETVADQAEKDGEHHGMSRWYQGFDLPEMLREIMHLRAILIHRLGIFETENEADFGMTSRLFVTTTLHKFLDKMGIHATEQYMALDLQKGGGVNPRGPSPIRLYPIKAQCETIV